jgi:hypothetical protein
MCTIGRFEPDGAKLRPFARCALIGPTAANVVPVEVNVAAIRASGLALVDSTIKPGQAVVA